MDYKGGSQLVKYQWDVLHDPQKMLFKWLQGEEEGNDITTRQDVEWILEIYSPWYSEKFTTSINQEEMQKYANAALKLSFTQEQIKSLGSFKDIIPTKKDGSLPVAILKHYPNAKYKGVGVYYTIRENGGIKIGKFRYYKDEFPVDISLHTGEFDNTSKVNQEADFEGKLVNYQNLAYDFVWETMTQKSWNDKLVNWMKEIWYYPNVEKDNENKITKSFEVISKYAKEDKKLTFKSDEKILYIYDFPLDSKKIPMALYIIGDNPSFKKQDLIEFKVEKEKDYTIIGFCEEKDKQKPKLLIQVANEYVKDIMNMLMNEDESTLTCKSGYCCSVCSRDLTVTKDKLDLIYGTGSNITSTLANYFNTALKTAGFNSCKSQTHFFAQSYVETKGYKELAENPNYRYEGVLELHNQKNDAKLFFNQEFFDNNTHLDYFHFMVYKNLKDNTGNYTGQNYKTFYWKSSSTDKVRVPTGGNAAYKFTKGKGTFDKVVFSFDEQNKRNRQLFSIIYANKFENGPPSTEDGYNYRGQGAIHLTWKENYRHAQTYAKELFKEDFDWVNHPEYLVNNEKDAVYSAVAYFYFRLKKDINKINEWDIDKVSYNVNGGYNGLPQRQAQYIRLSTEVFNLSECKTKSTE